MLNITCLKYKDFIIHIIDFPGKINLSEGLSHINQLEKQFESSHSNGTTIRLLLDLRNTAWDSEESHNKLARAARQKFEQVLKDFNLYIAILNNQYNFQTFENEHWFTDKDEALKWLLQQPVKNDLSS